MSRGAKIIILIVAGLVAIGAIAYFIIWPLFSRSSAPQPGANVNAGAGLKPSDTPAQDSGANANYNAPLPVEVASEVQAASSAKSVARTFAERLDTYTNRNGLVNLSDLKSISSASVWNYIDGTYRKELVEAMPAGDAYYSVVSTAINVNVAPDSQDEMSVKVAMQRVEGGAVSRTSYPTLDLKLKKSDGEWRVSWLEWEK